MSDAEEKTSLHQELVQPFADAARAPRPLWGNNLQYLLEGFIYFGVLNYLVIYATEDIGLSEVHASWIAGLLTGGITFSQFLFGGISDKLGARKALLISLLILIVGRALLSASGSLGLEGGEGWSPALFVLLTGVTVILLGYGLYEPASYSIVRLVTTPKTAAMGFAMLYALMNLGGWLPSFLSPLRRWLGIAGVYWVFTGLTLVAFLATLLILSRRTMSEAIKRAKKERKKADADSDDDETEEEEENDERPREKKSIGQSIGDYLRNHPLADLRFAFFIFILIPVQTLFAHNWLTLPLYVSRTFEGTWLGDNFEFAVNLNPLLVFVMVPIVAAYTRKVDVYKLMVVGTLIMALPPFLLAFGTSVTTLAIYILVLTLGESIWQPRFLQYAAEIAPEGQTGAYIGIARLPWFLTKMITAAYSGWFLQQYCPAEGERNTETMWVIYGGIALVTPVALIVAKRWMIKDFKTSA